MNRSRLLLIGAVLIPLVGCTWLENVRGKGDHARGGGGEQVQPVKAEQLVAYINDRSARLQTLDYDDIRVVATDHIITFPGLRGSLVAGQPRNFRMTGGGTVGAKVDLGSNSDQFWMYLDAPASKPMFVFASHTDFEQGKARLPAGSPPFEPDWVMQALGMTVLAPPSPSNQYTVSQDNGHRTYTLSWNGVAPNGTPNGQPVIKEIVFNADRGTDSNPQVKKHIIKDRKGKVICTAEIKQAKTAPSGGPDSRPIQYPTLVVLKWEEQKFKMELDLKQAVVNRPFTEDQARSMFTRPNLNTRPIDLARYDFPENKR
jgi:hypothetical protein